MDHLLDLNIDVIDNRNIKYKHLNRKGLHLNDSGSEILARILKKKNRFEKIKDVQVSLTTMNLGIL